MNRRILSVALALIVVACGKRGDPRPPVPVIPAATSDLAVMQRGDRMVLSWSYPALTTAGRSLTSVRRISIYRYSEELPVAHVIPADLDPGLPKPVALFAKIPLVPKAQFVKLSTRIESIEKDELASATAGAKLIFSDAAPTATNDGRPVRLTYAVVTEGDSARGDTSNLATIVPLPVAPPPSGLKATARAEGVVLEWAAADAGSPAVAGYHILRTAPGELPNELTPPVTTAIVTGATWVDVPAYGEHEYRVVAVTGENPLLTSELSQPAKAVFRDLVPPPVPANLTPLIETNAVRLLWDPVAATDLAGYKVYRHEGIGHVEIVDAGGFPLTPQPIVETTWLDSTVNLGIAFRYEVTSVDKNGNESAPAKSAWVVSPKTP